MADDESNGPAPPRLQKGQTERLPAPGASPPGTSTNVLGSDTDVAPVSQELLHTGLDPVRSEDIDALPMPEAEQEDITGKVLANRYRLDEHLADGGMGSVYEGTHLELGMPVAVKVMLPAMSAMPGYVRRFRREARVMSTLRHRNIVRVLDFGVDDRRPFIVMELLEGQSIARWLFFADGLPSLAEIDELMRQVFDALHVAHEAGIVHRDLKPDNIYLASEGDGIYLIKLLDFGLAHLDDPSDTGPTLTQSGMVSGTPEYMSPEQCHSLAVGPRADIYALGCIVTELLQGDPPFLGESHMAIMSKQMFMAPPSLTRPEDAEPIPPLLERLRLEMLAKDPNQRPESVAELRKRWAEALRPDANANVFPGRKKQGDAGGRAERVPDWTAPERFASPAAVIGELLRVAFVRLDRSEKGLTEDQIVGLAAGGVSLTDVDVASNIPDDAVAVIVDAGTDVDGACAWMVGYDDTRRPRPLILADTSGDQVGRLVAAGAGDLVNYPLDPSTILRKLKKLQRRFTRRKT